ncbi:MAG: arginine decarboxylase, partial [Bacteroidia bacterium]|nr:arginine decarboxylase [Bacteroidia bacterium]
LYKQYIVDMVHDGFENIIPVLDNKEEFNYYANELDIPVKLGIRIASEEKPDFEFYTSRLGIRSDEIIDFYNSKIKDSADGFKITMLHFFINSGIRDTPYYWNELEKHVTTYCKFKKVNPDLTMLDIGGGLPFKNSLTFEYDYSYMIDEIVRRIKEICNENDVEEPDLVTEFGSYTVAESSGVLFKVLGRKQQNDREKWLMLDGSLMTTLPDIWAINQRFILLPINNWDAEYERVNLGGMTCDSHDYYNQDAHINAIFLPKTRKVQYLGFFHTGAYQETLSGLGGIHHCLIPTPRHILISRNRNETINIDILSEEQNSKQVLKLLGY